MNIGTLFCGGGGVDIGARAAGLALAWGIEYDAEIADVARRNLGNHIITADILDVDPAMLPHVTVLHASPPCPNFSVAKTDRGETPHDIALGRKVAEFVRVLMPRIFTLENVYAYRHSESWTIIADTLNECGYWHNIEHVNAADFGVPQSRQRMIVRAVRGGWVPMLPAPVEHVGWYAAIADLVDDLPDSKLAPWQLRRLPEEVMTQLFANGGYDGNIQSSHPDAPAMTCGANCGPYNAVLVDLGNTSRDATQLDESMPSCTIAAWHGRRPSHVPIAILPHRVVGITPRALARFQTFPDWYELPSKRTLAARIIGNAVPPLLYQRIIEQLIEYLG